jgi:PPP family 3-phenylpropionic acid transporter
LIHRWFSGRLQGRGQALYSSIGFGVGGGLGSFYSGYAWESLGPSATYLIAAGLAAAGWFIAWLALDTSAVDGAAVESGAAKYR